MRKEEAIKYGYPYTVKVRIHGEPYYLKLTEAIKEHKCFLCHRIIFIDEAYYFEIYPKWENPAYFNPIKICWDCLTLQKPPLFIEKGNIRKSNPPALFPDGDKEEK